MVDGLGKACGRTPFGRLARDGERWSGQVGVRRGAAPAAPGAEDRWSGGLWSANACWFRWFRWSLLGSLFLPSPLWVPGAARSHATPPVG